MHKNGFGINNLQWLMCYKTKSSKYLDLTRASKKLWSKRVTAIPIVFWAHGTVSNGLAKILWKLESRVRNETTQLNGFKYFYLLPIIYLHTVKISQDI